MLDHEEDVPGPFSEPASTASPKVEDSILATALEAKLQIVQQPELGVYLRSIAEALVRSDAGLASHPVGVLVVEDQGGRWMSTSIPGTRVYLPKGLLKTLEFESEIAALIALQLAHVALGHLRPEAEWSPRMTEAQLFGPAGVLVRDERQILAAIDSAAKLLYSAGIDPRGLVSLCSRLQNGGELSPYDAALLLKMRERSREVVSRFAPLRNPVIRSEAFFAARERIRRL